MELTPQTLHDVEFREARRGGTTPDDVDDFLERVAAGVEALQDACARPMTRAESAEGRLADAHRQLDEAAAAAGGQRASPRPTTRCGARSCWRSAPPTPPSRRRRTRRPACSSEARDEAAHDPGRRRGRGPPRHRGARLAGRGRGRAAARGRATPPGRPRRARAHVDAPAARSHPRRHRRARSGSLDDPDAAAGVGRASPLRRRASAPTSTGRHARRRAARAGADAGSTPAPTHEPPTPQPATGPARPQPGRPGRRRRATADAAPAATASSAPATPAPPPRPQRATADAPSAEPPTAAPTVRPAVGELRAAGRRAEPDADRRAAAARRPIDAPERVPGSGPRVARRRRTARPTTGSASAGVATPPGVVAGTVGAERDPRRPSPAARRRRRPPLTVEASRPTSSVDRRDGGRRRRSCGRRRPAGPRSSSTASTSPMIQVAVGVDGRRRASSSASSVSATRSAMARPSSLRRSLSARTSSRASALGAQVVVELEVEGHGPAAVLGQGERLVALGPHLDLVGGRAARRPPRSQPSRVELAPQRRSRRPSASAAFTSLTLGPSRGPSARKLGTTVQRHEARQRVDVLERLDVQLVGDLGRARSSSSVDARVQQQRPAQRLAHLDLGVGAGRPAERHQPAGGRPSRPASAASARARRLGPVGQVHRRLAGERGVQLVGQERAERRQQLRP